MARIFLSCVTNEFKSYRTAIADNLRMPGVEIELQETFLAHGDSTLTMLDDYIRGSGSVPGCDAVIHVVGEQCGTRADAAHLQTILARYPYDHLRATLGLTREFVDSLTYTQWEAWLAVLHGRRLYICTAMETAAVDQSIADAAVANAQRQSQRIHLESLRQCGRYQESPLRFSDAQQLSIALLRSLRQILPQPVIPVSPQLNPSLGRLFKGRDEWLVKLRKALLETNPAHVDAQRVALWGPGGIGKTRVATEYAHVMGFQHSALLVVTATTPADLHASVANLSGCLKLPQAASTDAEVRYQAALDWLDQPGNRNWFLLVDNVDDEESFRAVEQLIRRLRYGRVVITGRIRRWPDYVTDLQLEVLERPAAAEYLLEATEGKRIADANDDQLALRIADDLGCLALGLVQAKAVICRGPLSFRQYLAEWTANHELILDDQDFDPTLTGYPRTVATTWQTSYNRLTPAGKVVFDAMCWLSPDPIPDRLILQAWPAAALAEIPEEFREQINDRRPQLLRSLYDFCLADAPIATDRCLTMHRLIQDVGRIWQQKHETAATRQLLIASLVHSDFVREGIDNLILQILSKLRQVVPHVHALMQSSFPLSPQLQTEYHRVLSEISLAEGRWSAARQHALQSVTIAEAAFQGAEFNDQLRLLLAKALCHHTNVLAARGHLDEAFIQGSSAVGISEVWRESTEAGQQSVYNWALVELGRVRENQGDQAAALVLFEQSRQISDGLCQREPDNLAHRRELGIALNNCGRVREKQGDQAAALVLFEQSRQISDGLCQREPDNLAHRRELGIALNNCGRVREKQGDQAAALVLFEQSRQISDGLCQREPDNLAHRRELGIALENCGRVRENQGDQAAALVLFEQSRQISDGLCQREPDNLAHRRDLGIALNNCGRVRENQGDQAAALVLFEQSRQIRDGLCQREPDNLAHRRELGIALNNCGRVRENQGDQAAALVLFEQSRQIRDGLCQREPDNLAHRRELGIALENCGRVREKQGDQAAALVLFEQSRQISDGLCQREPDNLAHRRELGIALENCGRVREKQGDQAAALVLFEQSRQISDGLCQREPDNLAHRRDLGIALNNCGRVRENQGDQAAALVLFEQSRQIRDGLCQREPDNLAHRRELGIALENCGRVRENQGDQAAALVLFEQSRQIRDGLCQREPDNLAHRRELGIANFYCGRALQHSGRISEAISWLQEAQAIFRELTEVGHFGDSRGNLDVVERQLRLARSLMQ